jgi:TRAP-type uncharacterized transport system fused permease subunit
LRGAWVLYADGPLTGARVWASVMRGLRMIESLELGARNAVSVSIACAVAGIIVGVVGLTGLGLKFSSMMISLSGGNIVIALGLVLIASLMLGLGLPVTASYIVLIVLVGPALHNEFGIPLLIAHLVVFWYSQDSNVTPPWRWRVLPGGGGGAKPMETSVQAWKFAKGLYLIPLFMVFNPEIIYGGPLPGALDRGHRHSGAGGLCKLVGLFWPDFGVELASALVIVAVFAINWLAARRAGPRPA